MTVLAVTLCAVAIFLAMWLVAAVVAAGAFALMVRGLDEAARQLHNEERRRRGEALDELAPRRRRRSQR